MNLSTLVLILIPLFAIPASAFVSAKQKWTDLAVSLVLGCAGMLIVYLASFVFVISRDFWEVWAYGGMTSFISAWLTLSTNKRL